MTKKKKKKNWKDEPIKSLKEAAAVLDREIFTIRNELSWNKKIEKPHRLKEMRKEKARILTMLTLKERLSVQGEKA